MENNDDDADENIFPQLILVLVLTIVNAFFAMSELAVLSVNKSNIKVLAEEGNKKAKLVQKLNEDQTKFLSTIQVGITLAGFFSSATAAVGLSESLGAVLEGWKIPQGETIALVTITIILSLFTLIFGELFPKRIALANPDKIAMFVVYPINLIKVVTTPIVKFLSGTCNLLGKITGLNKVIASKVTKEEIKYVVETGVSDGIIDEERQKMIESVLKFKDLTATDVMTPRTSTFMIDIEDKLSDYIDDVFVQMYSRIPVYQENRDNIIGILHIKDLFREYSKNGKDNVDIKKILRQPLFVPEMIKIDKLFEKMKKEKNQIAILLDEFSGVSGIVTMEDIVEEVVGSIRDEYDDEFGVKKIKDDEYLVEGTLPIQEINREVGLELDEENPDYDTIAGLIITSLDQFPKAGDKVQIDNVLLTVEEKNNLKITRVRIKILPVEEEE